MYREKKNNQVRIERLDLSALGLLSICRKNQSDPYVPHHFRMSESRSRRRAHDCKAPLSRTCSLYFGEEEQPSDETHMRYR